MTTPPKQRRLPRQKDAPRLKPACGQCGREMSGLFPRESDYLSHELQTGVELHLRVFAQSTDPHRCGHIALRISEEGLCINWLGGGLRQRWEWADLVDALRRVVKAGAFEFVEEPEVRVTFGVRGDDE